MLVARLKFILSVIVIFFFSGCSIPKTKIADYYLSKADKIYSLRNPSESKLKKAYDYISKSLQWQPRQERAFELLENITSAAYRGGYIKSLELESQVLINYLKTNPGNWKAHFILINNLGLQGDVSALGKTAKILEKTLKTLKKDEDIFSAYMCLGICYGTMLSWIESEGLLSINRDAETTVKKVHEYGDTAEKFDKISKTVSGMLLADSGLGLKVNEEISNSFHIIIEDIKGADSGFSRMLSIYRKIRSTPSFLRSVKMCVEGNASLVKKKFALARSKYESVLSNNPSFIYAKKQLSELDFQQGAILALNRATKKQALKLLYSAYERIDELLRSNEKRNMMPFVKPNKFIASAYSLKATIISAINTVKRKGNRERRLLEKEFEYSLKEAIKYDPENNLAKSLLDRYAREGF